ncbi:NADP-dependent malic enzyme, partial [bacterium]|nr:NADP-dependent malic enzyme [bacterium]
MKEKSLEYHKQGRPGKIEVISSKPCATQQDLSLAYTPGVAWPVKAIADNPEKAYEYTSKGNLVAVVSNGTAILGLGNLGALASKPVMEGKGILFKRFADIDVFDLEINSNNPDEIIKFCQMLEPTFGGINLEDIKAPECFYIEEELKKTMDIPVFHDDQHGTAIIAGAGFLNAVEVVGKKIDKVKIVFNGAGAAGISCAKFLVLLGAKKENIVLCDKQGVIYRGRKNDMNGQKEFFQSDTQARTLSEVMKNADVFLGLSVGNVVTPDMLKSMSKNPIVFAMANPDPEIDYPAAISVRDDLVMATGRSDYPNQVNNVLGFPFIFRGALDVRAKTINDEMKLAASRALADLAKREVPKEVSKAYGGKKFVFGKEYIIPKPFDSRVLPEVSSAVAKAAMDSGVALKPIDNWDAYRDELRKRLGISNPLLRQIKTRAKNNPKRVIFAEAENYKMLKAAEIAINEKIAIP